MPFVREQQTPIPTLFGSLTGRDAIGHRGELVQWVFEDDRAQLHRGLITLPLVGLHSTARLQLSPDSELKVHPPSKAKALRAAQLTLAHLGTSGAGGELEISSEIPIGHGYGSSTADVVASIRVAAAAVGVNPSPISISRLAVSAERHLRSRQGKEHVTDVLIDRTQNTADLMFRIASHAPFFDTERHQWNQPPGTNSLS
jgi:hypothetical protein